MESGYKMMSKLMSLKKRPTAIFAGNILIAMGILQFIRDNDFSIPEDFSVIGVHETFFTSILHPSLTTVHMPLQKLGETGVANLVNNIQNKGSQKAIIIPGVTLLGI